ncbi:MAG: hypothetical protein VXY65_03910 [Actinomycetota bacterium]|nr:hypothetical protein [Actinomycetota bacterium]MEC8486191.1 hypothetical protein [Actinomycetota bacterium]MEC8502603.1 hypothetical protein [Actinomycetota bacterium]MEC8521005.1 hypothetical protein [Actinomycetota bacterium]MED5328958.1 hypothetical protein [Actinomycetota bacterium]
MLIALSGPDQSAGFPVFVDLLAEYLDVSRWQLTFAYLLGRLASSTTGTRLGRVIDRRGVGEVVPWDALGSCRATVLAERPLKNSKSHELRSLSYRNCDHSLRRSTEFWGLWK